ncbi:MAG: GtrA family protein [Phascolarctobacterium sp.]|nr:GtrA family protein [Phascolarctobacterium sp.]
MKRKVIFGYDYTNNELVKLLLYLFVGGTAAVVEWILFFILYMEILPRFRVSMTQTVLLATTIAFCLSTLYHYFLGNVLVFESGSKYDRGKELSLVFLVSIVGLILNLILMYFFASLLKMNAMLAKILTSFIVVAWNYLSRKKWIFRS